MSAWRRRVWVRTLLRERVSGGGAVLVSSHLLAEPSQVADRYVVIDRGRVLAQASRAELAAAAVSCALLGLVCAGACAAARSTPAALTAVFALLAAGHVGGLLAGRLHGPAQALAAPWPFSALPAVNSADRTTPASGASWAVLAAWAAVAWLIGLRRATAP